MRRTIAIILGGGKGTRLFPLTLRRSKPAVPLAGKFRLIDVPISNCINSGFRKIFVLTQYNSESLNRHINRTYQFDQFSKGFVSLLAAEQTPENFSWFQGTADAIRQMMRHFNAVPHKHVIILSGDQLYRMDYRGLLDFHMEKGASLTISGIPVPCSEATSLGIMQVDSDNQINSIAEKPNPEGLDWLVNPKLPPDTPFYASMGIYVFNREFLAKILDENSGIDLVNDIIPIVIKKKKAFAYRFDNFWADIGTISRFYKVNLSLTDVLPKFSLYDTDFPIYTRPRGLPGAKVHNSFIDGAIISEGSIIESATIRRSIIGIRSMIKSGVIIEDSIVMGEDYYEMDFPEKYSYITPHVGIGANSVLKKCIIDKNVRIGTDVKILNEAGKEFEDNENYYIRDGIVIVPKDAIIPDGTVI